jgi:hypothetical protein
MKEASDVPSGYLRPLPDFASHSPFCGVSWCLIREAVFSYTVHADLVNDSDTQSEVKIIGQLVTDACFARPA